MVEVDEADDDERGEEKEEHDPFDAEADSQIERDRRQCGDQLDDEVAKRDALVTVPAAAAERQPAEQRDVVVPGDRVLAPRATRARVDDRLLGRDAQDAYVGEAADDGAEDEEDEGGQGGLRARRL